MVGSLLLVFNCCALVEQNGILIDQNRTMTDQFSRNLYTSSLRKLSQEFGSEYSVSERQDALSALLQLESSPGTLNRLDLEGLSLTAPSGLVRFDNTQFVNNTLRSLRGTEINNSTLSQLKAPRAVLSHMYIENSRIMKSNFEMADLGKVTLKWLISLMLRYGIRRLRR